MSTTGTASAPAAEDNATPAADQVTGTPAEGAPAPAATTPEASAPADDTSAPAAENAAEDDKGAPAEDPAPEADPEAHADDDADDDMDGGEIPEVYRRKLSKARREAANLRERAKTAEAEALRWRVGVQAGLEPPLIKRLQGATEAEMLADAEELLAVSGLGQRTTPPGVPAETTSGRRGPVDPAELAAAEADLTKIGARIYDR